MTKTHLRYGNIEIRIDMSPDEIERARKKFVKAFIKHSDEPYERGYVIVFTKEKVYFIDAYTSRAFESLKELEESIKVPIEADRESYLFEITDDFEYLIFVFGLEIGFPEDLIKAIVEY